MTIVQISDTHNCHRQLANLQAADVLVHCGNFTDMGTEQEVLDFLNWLIELPYKHKVFVTGNHDLCLWEAADIEGLPSNVHFLQDRGCEIEGMKFYSLGYNHSEQLIPNDIDILVTHEPPCMILDKSNGTHWGNAPLRNKVMEISPKYHLFGHAHEAYGTIKHGETIFSNAAILDDHYKMCHQPKVFCL